MRTVEENRALPYRRQAMLCYQFASACSTWQEAAHVMIRRGYAEDEADFDAKVAEVEDASDDFFSKGRAT